ncbi:ATP synthase subunit delta [Galdieria sulphuraria]|nr:ATP synthase subunit delta [Galdieria sulphuraria]
MLRIAASRLRVWGSTYFSRSFCSESSSASSTGSEQGSTLGSSVASRYASTLLSLARKEGALDKITKDVKQFRTLESDHPDFKRFLQDPTIPQGEKQQFIQELLKREQFSDLFYRFVGVIEENRRTEDLSSVIETLDNMLRGDKGNDSFVDSFPMTRKRNWKFT